MCTVSLIRPPAASIEEPDHGALCFRVVVNRDELRRRRQALPPLVVSGAFTRAVMPVDPEGAGTWVAATDAGLVFALLNGPEAPRDPRETPSAPSRGSIIPRLVESAGVDEALERLQAIDVGPYRPWRLLVASRTQLLDAERTPAGRLRYRKTFLPARFMATSSSVDLAAATRERARVFRDVVSQAAPAAQDAFHAHQCSDAPGLGVRMERADARTVSRTIVEVGRENIALVYQPLVVADTRPSQIILPLAHARERRGAA